MPIYTNNTSMANCMVGDNQVSKILLNDQTIWENWVAWSDSVKNSYGSYPSSPKYAEIATGSKIRVQSLTAVGEKYVVSGEYGSVDIQAYYDGSWHTLAKGNTSFDYTSAHWTGDLVCEKVRANYGFQVCASVYVQIIASGLKKGS